ncbi:MAG: hypothetical protein Q8N05_16635 [Bacteroidota bacterium]|nr:hypothetical protein [Bacteroidota bacterium]
MLDTQYINLSRLDLERIITTAVEIGVNRFAVENGLKKEYMSQGVAYKKYGRHTIDRWTREGKITPVKQVRAVKFKAVELDKLSRVNELHTKFIGD